MKVTLIAKARDNVLVEVDGIQVVLSTGLAQVLSVIPDYFSEGVSSIETQINPNKEEGMTSQQSERSKNEKLNKVEHIRLNDLKKGQRAVIIQVGGKGAVKRRMMDMGIVPGSTISIVRVAPLGDPIEYLVKGYSLSLRRSEAREILVEVVAEEVE